jgi:hypothetical protein
MPGTGPGPGQNVKNSLGPDEAISPQSLVYTLTVTQKTRDEPADPAGMAAQEAGQLPARLFNGCVLTVYRSPRGTLKAKRSSPRGYVSQVPGPDASNRSLPALAPF